MIGNFPALLNCNRSFLKLNGFICNWLPVLPDHSSLDVLGVGQYPFIGLLLYRLWCIKVWHHPYMTSSNCFQLIFLSGGYLLPHLFLHKMPLCKASIPPPAMNKMGSRDICFGKRYLFIQPWANPARSGVCPYGIHDGFVQLPGPPPSITMFVLCMFVCYVGLCLCTRSFTTASSKATRVWYWARRPPCCEDRSSWFMLLDMRWWALRWWNYV